ASGICTRQGRYILQVHISIMLVQRSPRIVICRLRVSTQDPARESGAVLHSSMCAALRRLEDLTKTINWHGVTMGSSISGSYSPATDASSFLREWLTTRQSHSTDRDTIGLVGKCRIASDFC